jgi:hypothetical protein
MTLADEYARAKAQLDDAEKRVKALRAKVLSLGLETVAGTHYRLTISLSERESLDSGMVRAILPDDVLASVTRRSIVETIRVKANV